MTGPATGPANDPATGPVTGPASPAGPGSSAAAGRVAWFHCFSGVAGDMVLAALIDAGADPDAVRDVLAGLRLPGWSLRVSAATRGGIGATRVSVDVDGGGGPARPFAELERLVLAASLPDRVARRSLAALRALAAAESRVHRVPLASVHLHELGGHDTLVDVVGSAAALELLGVDDVAVSPIAVGTGTLRGAHGPLPNPSPAVVHLLRDAVVSGRDTPLELTTPTGAALMATWGTSFGPLPAMRVRAAGFGAGSADPPGFANCLQVVVGDRAGDTGQAWHPEVLGAAGPGAGGAPVGPGAAAGGLPPVLDVGVVGWAGPGGEAGGPPWPGATVQDVAVVETTVDDVTGEVVGYAIDELLRAGALDAWATPVLMKRGRPGHVVSALAVPATLDLVRQVLARETGTLGVRVVPVRRWVAPRSVGEVEVSGHRVRVKVSPGRVKAEHRDAAAAARALGVPVRDVAVAAEQAWRAGGGAAEQAWRAGGGAGEPGGAATGQAGPGSTVGG